MCHQVLDLDETLVHSTLDSCTEPDFSFPVAFNGREHRVHVRRRPHLQAFLERCAELFEVVVFTASQKVYAEQLLNVLDPSRSVSSIRRSAVQRYKSALLLACRAHMALVGVKKA